MKVGYMLMGQPRDAEGKPVHWLEYLKYLKKLGLEGVDLFAERLEDFGCSVAEAKGFLSDLSLSPTVYCVRTDLISPDPAVRRSSLDAVRRGIDACGKLGISHVFSYGGQHSNSGEEAIARYIDGLSQAAELASDAGMILSIENAGKMCHTDEELERVVNAVNSENMKVTLDPGNFVLAGCDPHAAAKRLAPRVSHVHVKNFVAAPESRPRPFRYCPAGEGIVDYRTIADILRSAGYEGFFSFEPEGGADAPVEAGMELLAKLTR
jgi:sugar phosphate isomerase/epimerase